MKTGLTLLTFLTLFTVNTFAQDLPHTLLGDYQTVMSLVYSVAFSPDGHAHSPVVGVGMPPSTCGTLTLPVR